MLFSDRHSLVNDILSAKLMYVDRLTRKRRKDFHRKLLQYDRYLRLLIASGQISRRVLQSIN